MKKWTALLLAYGFTTAHATEPKNDTIKTLQPLDLSAIILDDDPYVAQLDSLLHYSFFFENPGNATETFKDIPDSAIVLSGFADSIYEQRLAELNAQTPMNLEYNSFVKAYIAVYSQRRREQVSRMMGLSQYYFPMFEEALDRHGMPLELKYLAVVESALNPLAHSRAGAKGLWQFMYATGKMQGLQVSSYVDERHDPRKSTEAACLYLKTLYGIFGDWELALAAYNSGPGNVNKAIRRSGGKRNYWEIRPFLPRETAGYVPAFIAVNYIMNHAADHYIYPSEVRASYFKTDTVLIKEQLSFNQISTLLDISQEELEFLNPAYQVKVIPKNDDPYALVLPGTAMGKFIANEDSIYALARQDFEQRKPVAPAYVEMDEKISHRVQRGEVLGTIAEKYGVSVSSLRSWNGLRGNTIHVGQRLTVYPRKAPSTATASASGAQKAANGDYLLYNVSSGDTFYSIARKYPGVSADNIMSWNNINSARNLRPGMKLKIYPNS